MAHRNDQETASRSRVENRGRDFGVAISRAFDVLGCFTSASQHLGLTEISRNSGLAKTTAFRIVYTLEELGYLIRNPVTRKYRLAWGLLPLSYPLLAEISIRQTVRPRMQALAERFKVNVNLGTLHRFSIVLIEAVRSDDLHSTRPDIGAVRPLFLGAIGPAVICGLDDADRTALMNRVKVARPDEYAKSLKIVNDAQESIAERGYYFSTGKYLPDVHAIAVPVRPGSLDIPLAFNCVYFGDAGTIYETRDRMAPAVIKMVAEFESTLRHHQGR